MADLLWSMLLVGNQKFRTRYLVRLVTWAFPYESSQVAGTSPYRSPIRPEATHP